MVNIKKVPSRGFTLIELIVVIGIVTLITGTVLVNYNSFGGKVLLRNLTYDLALTVREAQVYGISGRFQEGGEFNKIPIVIYFDRTKSNNNFLFYMFRDINGNFKQDDGELIAGYNLRQGFEITNISANDDSVNNINEVAIAFTRPEPDADIRDMSGGSAGSVYSNVRIMVKSPKGDELSVFVENAGQISVQRVGE